MVNRAAFERRVRARADPNRILAFGDHGCVAFYWTKLLWDPSPRRSQKFSFASAAHRLPIVFAKKNFKIRQLERFHFVSARWVFVAQQAIGARDQHTPFAHEDRVIGNRAD